MNFYDPLEVEDELVSDMVSDEEEGFMRGYLSA